MAFEQIKTFVFGCQRRQCIIGSWRSSQRSTDDRFRIHQSNRRNSTETTKNQAQFISFLRQFQVFIYLFKDFFFWNYMIIFCKFTVHPDQIHGDLVMFLQEWLLNLGITITTIIKDEILGLSLVNLVKILKWVHQGK